MFHFFEVFKYIFEIEKPLFAEIFLVNYFNSDTRICLVETTKNLSICE